MPMFVHLEIDPDATADTALFLRRGRALARPRTELQLCPYDVREENV